MREWFPPGEPGEPAGAGSRRTPSQGAVKGPSIGQGPTHKAHRRNGREGLSGAPVHQLRSPPPPRGGVAGVVWILLPRGAPPVSAESSVGEGDDLDPAVVERHDQLVFRGPIDTGHAFPELEAHPSAMSIVPPVARSAMTIVESW